MMRIPTNLHQQYPLETLVHLQRVNQSLHIYIENELKEVQDISPYLSLFKRRSSFKGRLKKDGIMPIRYARLHQHSYYSILDSLMSPKQMSELSEYYSAITDHGVLTGYFEFYQHMKKRNQIPIIGMEAYCEDIQGQQTRNHLVLLVENEQGLQNLIKLRSLAATNFHYRPHLKWEWLETYHEGLICLTACVSGEIPKAFRQQNPDLALTVLNRLISVFGRNQVFLEIQRHGIEPEEQVNPGIEWLSAQTGIPIVATSDSHYAKKEDAYIHGLVKQMTKSQNRSNIIRSQAALNITAVIMQNKNSPQESGAMVKASAGTIEFLPVCRVTNLSRALETLKQNGFWCIGMDGYAKHSIDKINKNAKIAVVMGSEGKGLRRLVQDNCDDTVKLLINPNVESLNVSVAAAIALYELSKF